jgi:diadenosine tetraphosphate (Ap4A) HIT family hydrolase
MFLSWGNADRDRGWRRRGAESLPRRRSPESADSAGGEDHAGCAVGARGGAAQATALTAASGRAYNPGIAQETAMSDTIFHKIIRREIPATIVFEDDHVIAFRDIAPQAPVHVLFVPKETIPTLNDVRPDQAEIVGRLAIAAANYAKQSGFAEDGYRIVMNCNDHGGQTVFQIHLHLLAGAPLGRFGSAL